MEKRFSNDANARRDDARTNDDVFVETTRDVDAIRRAIVDAFVDRDDARRDRRRALIDARRDATSRVVRERATTNATSIDDEYATIRRTIFDDVDASSFVVVDDVDVVVESIDDVASIANDARRRDVAIVDARFDVANVDATLTIVATFANAIEFLRDFDDAIDDDDVVTSRDFEIANDDDVDAYDDVVARRAKK